MAKNKLYQITVSRDKVIMDNVSEYLLKADHLYKNLKANQEDDLFYGDSQDLAKVEIAKMLRDEDRWLMENAKELDE